ncbi:scavenger receptor class B member 1-like isoform X1 [Photinus pyralis]|uniref:Scavenger receptor class B member 1 n=2 Tax=Photinus pyralis TaxID=7054 RepID=A0A1Y1KDR6_PHOPY|nr:scavenger receptor class B member 1-like isoform X1 [Photinus pyralis]
MKDIVTNWNKLLGRSYSAVNRSDCPTPKSPRNVALNIVHGRFKRILTLAFFGLVTFGSGILILLVQPYDLLFKFKNVLSDGGEIFELWRKPPVDLYLRVFLFNVTNRDAFLNGEEKLKVQEVGPYVYREIMSHEEVRFNTNGTMSTIPQHPLVWVPEMSEGNREDDRLVLPNIALLSIAQVVSTESFVTRLGLNIVIRQTDTQPLVEMTAREFMFGYESTIMSLGYQFLPSWISFEKLGLIDRMYDFEGDYETIFTGEGDTINSGLLDTYCGSTKIPQWEGHCGNIHKAADGTKFRGNIKENDTLLFFRKSMCRAYNLVPVNKTTIAGLDGNVYHFETNSHDNGLNRSENSCFCKRTPCMPAGLLDVHGCYYGFPIATSFPHFLDADPKVRESVEGTNPDHDKHHTYFVIEPKSGLPLEIAARFQINMVFGDLESMAHVEQFSNMILPLLWTENRLYGLPDTLQSRFRLYLNVAPVVEVATMYVSFVLGTLLLSFACWQYTKKIRTMTRPKTTWIDEYVEEDVIGNGRVYNALTRASLSDKELKTYYGSLITPLNQQIDGDHKGDEEDV